MNRIKIVSMWFLVMSSLLHGLPTIRPAGMKFPVTVSQPNTSQIPFMGKIILPAAVHEEMCIFHKGKTIAVDIQKDSHSISYLFSFLEPKTTNVFHILIASQLSFSTEPDTNTLKYLQVLPDTAYTFYELRGKRFYDGFGQLESYGWDIQIKQLPEGGIIPDETLIIMMSPELVENLGEKRWDIDTNTRVLPDIVISSQHSPDKISKMLARSRFASLDLQSLHKNKSKAVKQRYRRAVAMLVQ